MSALDWSKCPSVESIPGKVSGAWVFRDSIDDIIEWFDLTREQVTTVLGFAARSLEAPAHR
jgi:hypothetical protein